MCNFKSALLIPRFPSSDGFDIFHSEGVNSHTRLMEIANINPNDTRVNVAKLELFPYNDPSDINKWNFVLDEERKPAWLDDSMLSDAEYALRQICSRYITTDGKYKIVNINEDKKWYFNGKLHREDGPAFEWADGSKEWWLNGLRHREDGPAFEWADGGKEWWVNGLRHRTDGPAFDLPNGYKAWYINGKLHREDEPAIIGAGGYKAWYLNGKRHREDGPAIEWANGDKYWYIDDKSLTEEEFNSR